MYISPQKFPSIESFTYQDGAKPGLMTYGMWIIAPLPPSPLVAVKSWSRKLTTTGRSDNSPTQRFMDQNPAILAVWLYHVIPVYITIHTIFMEQFWQNISKYGLWGCLRCVQTIPPGFRIKIVRFSGSWGCQRPPRKRCHRGHWTGQIMDRKWMMGYNMLQLWQTNATDIFHGRYHGCYQYILYYPLVIPLVLKHEKEKIHKIHHLVPCIAAINLRFVEDFDAKKTCLMTRQAMCLVIDDRPTRTEHRVVNHLGVGVARLCTASSWLWRTGMFAWKKHMGGSINVVIPISEWFIVENPNLTWIICGYPYLRKPPYGCFKNGRCT